MMNYSIMILEKRIEQHRDEIVRIKLVPLDSYSEECKKEDIAHQFNIVKHLLKSIAVLKKAEL